MFDVVLPGPLGVGVWTAVALSGVLRLQGSGLATGHTIWCLWGLLCKALCEVHCCFRCIRLSAAWSFPRELPPMGPCI